MYEVTCETPECLNENIAIPVDLESQDSTVVCGACGNVIDNKEFVKS